MYILEVESSVVYLGTKRTWFKIVFHVSLLHSILTLWGRYRPRNFFSQNENLPKKPIEPNSIYVRCNANNIGKHGLKFDYFDESINDGIFLSKSFPFSEMEEGVNSQKTPLIALKKFILKYKILFNVHFFYNLFSQTLFEFRHSSPVYQKMSFTQLRALLLLMDMIIFPKFSLKSK